MGNIAIIPARSGSKGILDKNIIDLCGRPLLYYTIQAALMSECFDEVMVSTDSMKYADIAKRCGARVPFLRSLEMSSDNADSWNVVREVLLNYKNTGREFKYVALLQPTSPLRDGDDIRKVFERMAKVGANNAVTVAEVNHPVQWCFKLSENGLMDEVAESPYFYMRRQELEMYYRENGAVYIVDAKKIMNLEYNFYADRCVACIMPREKSIDIDSRFDLIIAEVELNSAILLKKQ